MEQARNDRGLDGQRAGELVGQTIDDRYLVERVLGRGGMGVVYAARHVVIDRRVALKVLRADLAHDLQILARFEQEAKAASRIGNPHIVEVSDFGRLADGATYFVMELLVGRSLAEAIADVRGEPLPLPLILHVGGQVARGLAAAHDAGIVHRDLKPDNVMLVARGSDPDFVKVVDFGIAKVGTSAERVTRAGQVFGTPHYMSPEQAEGKVVDARTDVYALGVMLFEMATGTVPFEADNFMGVLTQHLYKEPPPLPGPHGAEGGLGAVVRRCMAKRLEDRYATMDEVGAELERLVAGLPPLAASDSAEVASGQPPRGRSFARTAASHDAGGEALPVPPPHVSAAPRRSRTLPLALGGVLAALGLLGAASWTRRPHAEVPVASVPAMPTAVPDRRAQVSPVPPVSSRASVPSAVEVIVTLDPPDARLMLEGAPDGGALAPPFVFDVVPGVPVALNASRAGYKPLPIVLDGSNPRPVYKLAPARPARAAGAKPKCNIEDPGCDPWK